MANIVSTSSGLFEKCLKGHLQYDSFWKLLVGIVQCKFFFFWNVLYSVFLNHNWINNANNWFMFISVLYLPSIFLPNSFFEKIEMLSGIFETFCTCLCRSCCFKPYFTAKKLGQWETEQKCNSFLNKEQLQLQLLFKSHCFKIISSLCPDDGVIFYWKQVNCLIVSSKKKVFSW